MGCVQKNTKQIVMAIPRLPASIDHVHLKPIASPSLISSSGQCAMQAFGRDAVTKGFIEGLISGPATEIGTIVHRAIELADGSSNLIEVFEFLRTSREIELNCDIRRSHYSDLERAVGEMKWLGKMSMLQSHVGEGAQVEVEHIKTSATSINNRDTNPAQNLAWPSTTREVHLRSASLGLSGTVDLLELVPPDQIIVTDLKTGSITDEHGQPKYEYLLQLAAYEALAKEIWPSAKIKLFLEANQHLEVVVTDEIRGDLNRRLSALLNLIKDFSQPVVEAALTQTVGDQCLSCSIRHQCSSYREIMEDDSFGIVFANESQRNVTDGCGVVISKKFQMGSHVVNLRTNSNRIVQLRSRYEWQVSAVTTGDVVYFFGFSGKQNTNKMSNTVGLTANFSDDYLSGRNWSAELFTDSLAK